jgi:hypothetical protein
VSLAGQLGDSTPTEWAGDPGPFGENTSNCAAGEAGVGIVVRAPIDKVTGLASACARFSDLLQSSGTIDVTAGPLIGSNVEGTPALCSPGWALSGLTAWTRIVDSAPLIDGIQAHCVRLHAP